MGDSLGLRAHTARGILPGTADAATARISIGESAWGISSAATQFFLSLHILLCYTAMSVADPTLENAHKAKKTKCDGEHDGETRRKKKDKHAEPGVADDSPKPKRDKKKRKHDEAGEAGA